MPEASGLVSEVLEFSDPLTAIEEYFERGWTDGLPVVPPTPERVTEFLQAAARNADDTVAVVATRRRRITAEKVAINAVMAGCRAEYFRVVLAILEAMAAPEFNFHGSITSTGGSAQLVIVNGPIRQELGLNSGVNLFGPGNRANATIGRAVRLVLINVCGAVSGVLDQSTHGHGGKYSMVMAEDEEESPWPPLSVDLGLDANSSAVTVFAAEARMCSTQSRWKWPAPALGVMVNRWWSSPRNTCACWPASVGRDRPSASTFMNMRRAP